jgi:hypothetical protein
MRAPCTGSRGSNSQRPISGPALIGEIDGCPGGGGVAERRAHHRGPVQSTDVLRQLLRMRHGALLAYSRTPSLPERLRAAFARVPAVAAARV